MSKFKKNELVQIKSKYIKNFEIVYKKVFRYKNVKFNGIFKITHVYKRGLFLNPVNNNSIEVRFGACRYELKKLSKTAEILYGKKDV